MHCTKKNQKTVLEIQEWLVSYIAELLETDPEEIDETVAFERYGIASEEAIGLTGELEEWLEGKFEPTIFYDYPNIEYLAKYLSQENHENLI